MRGNIPISLRGIEKVFRAEIQTASGKVSSSSRDVKQFIGRSILPGLVDVRPSDPTSPQREPDRRTQILVRGSVALPDHVQRGVAIRATTEEVWVAPYFFRLICKNGAVLSQTLQARHIALSELSGRAEAEYAIGKAIRDCCNDESFVKAADQLRAAHEQPIDEAALRASLSARIAPPVGTALLGLIRGQLIQQGARTRFVLINAVTAVARDLPNPDLRWRLEEFGGGLLVVEIPPPPTNNDGAEAVLPASENLSEQFGDSTNRLGSYARTKRPARC